MARIALQNENADLPIVKEIFTEIKTKTGMVPPLYRALGLSAPILESAWLYRKKVMYEGNLPFYLKAAIGVRVSEVNKCYACVKVHSQILEKMGVNPYEIRGMVYGEVTDEKLQFVLQFVSIAAKDPAQLREDDFESLRQLGYSDTDILEMLTVMEMITGLNKLVIALDLQPED